MSRRTIRINFPRFEVEKLIKNGNLVLNEHKELGDSSPLDIFDMEKFENDLQKAVAFRKEAKELKRRSEILMQDARRLLGMDYDQNDFTPGTILNMMTTFRDYLLSLNKGHEEALNVWGFDVVIGSSQPFSKKRKNKIES